MSKEHLPDSAAFARRHAQIEQLYDECEGLDDAARKAHLTALGVDPDIQLAVLAMFATPLPGQRFAAIANRVGVQLLSENAESELGPYRVLGELGRGGMGRVLLAERADGAFQRQVAIKLLRGFPSGEALAALRRERNILARLDHPNIARLLDGGESARGQPFLVMEHVAGEAIDAYADRHALGLEARMRLVLEVAHAITHAHRHLVVHGDLKPANVWVDGEGRIKVLDFGIASLQPGAVSGAADVAVVGYATRAFASPEQLRGETIGVASDVYSLGALSYRLLSGQLPPECPPLASLSLRAQRLTQHTLASLPPPPGVNKSQLRAAIRGDLGLILTKAMAPNTADRYADMPAFCEDLQRYFLRRPVRARAASALYVTMRFLQRHALALLLGTIISVSVIGLGLQVLVSARRSAIETQVVRGVSTLLRDAYSGVDPRQRGAISAKQLIDEGEAHLLSTQKVEPLVQARLQFVFALVRVNVGEAQAAHATLAKAIALREQTLGHGDLESARMRAAQLQISLTLAQVTRAEQQARELQALRRYYPMDREDQIEVDLLGAQLAALQEQNTLALDRFKSAYDSALALYGNDQIRLARPAFLYGQYALAQGQPQAAKSALLQADHLFRTVFGAQSAQVTSTTQLLAKADSLLRARQ